MDVTEFLYRRRNRCVGQLLGQLERDIYPHLTQPQQERTTALIKSKIGSYHSDVLDTLDDGADMAYNSLGMEIRDAVDDQSEGR